MMDYEVFREVVSERIKDFLPPIFSSYKVKINTVRKVNEEKEALIMMPEKSGELTAMPNIYLDEMYEEFQKVEDLDVVLRLMAAMVIHYTCLLYTSGFAAFRESETQGNWHTYGFFKSDRRRTTGKYRSDA